MEYTASADLALSQSIANIEVSKEKIEARRQEIKEELTDRLETMKTTARENKKTEEFRKLKEEIKDQILQVPDETFSMKVLDMANAARTDPGASDVLVT
jgi:predicted Holliday junction resolvase-like endonuclease